MSLPWRAKAYDPAATERFSREAGVDPLLGILLYLRGVRNPAEVERFLTARRKSLADPETLPGAVEAADRLVRAVRDGRKIVVYGDYDVDGVCGTSILWTCLKLAGAKDAEYYIPHRLEEGYGLNAAALEHLRRERGADVVVTVDCGITAVAEAERAREIGLELIITDHHTIKDVVPRPDVLVHPRLAGARADGFADLCGCVAFKLAWQICKGFGDGKKASPQLREFLVHAMGLVALATLADLMPMHDENRIFVRHGLLAIQDSPSVGLRALVEVAGHAGKKLNSGHVGFQLAPRLNAAGRLEQARMAVELLTTEDPELARRLAAELDDCNRRRQQIEIETVSQARKQVEGQGSLADRGGLVVADEAWHKGVVGIVASRLVDAYHRPSLVLALKDGMAEGSGRSVAGFSLVKALRVCEEEGLLVRQGGHEMAAGVQLRRERLDDFRARFDALCREAIPADQRRKVLEYDTEAPLGVLSLRVVEAMQDLEPHGIGNPKPLLVSTGVRVDAPPRIVGERQNHAQVRFRQGSVVAKSIAFNLADRVRKLTEGTICAIAYTPCINEWNGRREIQLELKDIHVEGHDPEPTDGEPS